MNGVEEYLSDNMRRQREFFRRSDPGDLLIAVGCAAKNPQVPRPAGEEPVPGAMHLTSEEHLATNACEMGAASMRAAARSVRRHYEESRDDYCPCAVFKPGSGYSSAMFSGADLRFLASSWGNSNYTVQPVIETWDDVDTAFSLNNRWVDYAMDFWRGAQTEYTPDVAVAPLFCRSPLDLANDMRGDRLFIDMYDSPDEVERLVRRCAEKTVALDGMFRDEFKFLREGPGGALGMRLTAPTMVFNGDPLDLISEEMGERFNRPSFEMITEYCLTTVIHHHSIGVSRALAVSGIEGLTVQEVFQDPNGPMLRDSIDDNLIEASLRVPILLEWSLNLFDNIREISDFEGMIEALSNGRFILNVGGADKDQCRRYVDAVHRVTGLQ